MTMNKDWPKLEKPPVVVAIFQLKFNIPNFTVDGFQSCFASIQNQLPHRHNNIQVGIDLGKTAIPLGESTVNGKSTASLGSCVFSTPDQRTKLSLSNDTITFIEEREYNGWGCFKATVLKFLEILQPILAQGEVIRTSIRFINRFSFPDFDRPQDYVNMQIASTGSKESEFPLRQYGFRLMYDVSGKESYVVENHNVENVQKSVYLYTFDIDVLNTQLLTFELSTIDLIMEDLRTIKNTVFFDTLTNKTLETCK